VVVEGERVEGRGGVLTRAYMFRVVYWPGHVTSAFFIFPPCITMHLDKLIIWKLFLRLYARTS
jgi:hypothetical protein